jgi:predicted permease
MSLIEKIQKKPQAAKVRLIWTITIVVVAIMIIVWVISSKFSKRTPTDTTLFQTAGQGFKDVQKNFKK